MNHPKYVSDWTNTINSHQYDRTISQQTAEQIKSSQIAAVRRWAIHEKYLTLAGVGVAALNAYTAADMIYNGSIPIVTPALCLASALTVAAVRGLRDGTIADITNTIERKVLDHTPVTLAVARTF